MYINVIPATEPEVAEIEENAISEEERLAREALLTEKMAKMREKNEAIRKRYDEVQEDLKNAQAISSQVKVESESDDESKKPIRKVINKTPPRDRESKKFTPRRQNSESNEQQSPEQAPSAASARPIHAFGEVNVVIFKLKCSTIQRIKFIRAKDHHLILGIIFWLTKREMVQSRTKNRLLSRTKQKIQTINI
jgi:hypothetical protein